MTAFSISATIFLMQLSPNQIHIWNANLSISDEQEANLWPILSRDEQVRASRFHFPIHKKYFVAARSKLRELLALYLQVSAKELVFAYAAHGKPYLEFPHTNLQFNLSHTDNMAAFAFTLDSPIGIDIEKTADVYQPALATRFFSPTENSNLLQLPLEERTKGFYRIWARKEAIIKATGEGLTLPLSSFSVSVEDIVETIYLNNHHGWVLLPLFIQEGYQSAVATNQVVSAIQSWSLFNHIPQLDNVVELTI